MTDAELEHRLTTVESTTQEHTAKLSELESNQKILSDMASGIKVMGVEIKTLTGSVDKLDKKVDELEKKPGKRYEAIVSNVIWAVVAACLTYILSHIGL